MNTQHEIFNAKLESIKAQLEDLTKEFEANYKREKPVIEVGKVYKHNATKSVYMITGDKTGYGIGIDCDFSKVEDFKWNDVAEYYTEATKEEWETALTKFFDKYYEGVEKVDRSSFIDTIDILATFNCLGKTCWEKEEGFMYKGIFVLDEHGNIAKPVKEDITIGKNDSGFIVITNNTDLYYHVNLISKGKFPVNYKRILQPKQTTSFLEQNLDINNCEKIFIVANKPEEVKEDYDVWITNGVVLRKADIEYPDGKYKLVKVN